MATKVTDSLLIIFTKNPTLGRVKTRLAKTLGDEKALSIFKKLLAQAAKTASEWSGDVWVFYADFLPEKDLWSAVACQKFLQKGKGLGDRMAHAFEKGLAVYEKVVLMGTDIPGISTQVVDDAFSKLEQHDFVIGPTFDGGYFLVGMKEHHSYIFQDMEWSTPFVFVQTKDKILDRNQTVSSLSPLTDIDYESDLVGFEWLLE